LYWQENVFSWNHLDIANKVWLLLECDLKIDLKTPLEIIVYHISLVTYMPNFNLQKMSKLMCYQKNWGQHNFWIKHPIEKKIIIILQGYMFKLYVKLLWISNQSWLHRNLQGFSIVYSIDNWPLGIKVYKYLLLQNNNFLIQKIILWR